MVAEKRSSRDAEDRLGRTTDEMGAVEIDREVGVATNKPIPAVLRSVASLNPVKSR